MKGYQGMKITKRWLAMLLTAVLSLAMVLPTFASGGTNDGKITISETVKGQSYSIYRIFDLESYDKDEGAYLYTVNTAWQNFIKQSEISGTGGYVDVDATTGLVTWKKKDASGNSIDAAEFAKKALAYAKDSSHSITPVKSFEATGTTVIFDNLPLGYYLVDSSLGALCALNTTNPEAAMNEKNGQPTVDKKVKEGSNFGEEATAQIGDTVTFQTTITAQAGAEKYVLHDKMTKGLEFAGITSVVKNPGASQTSLTDADYTLKSTGLGDGCSFELAFSDSVCNQLSAGDTIVVTYTATLTKDAEIGGTSPNTNEAWLKYGDNAETTHETAKVYTYQFQLVKTDEGKNGIYNVLTGAKFKLYTAKTGGQEIKVVKVKDGEYRVAATNSEAGIVEYIEAGKPIIKGLDAKTYWLEETEAPDGFNKLEERVEVKIQGDNLVSSGTLSGTDPVEYTPGANPGGVHVENHAGGKLPSTGGIGTTIFYILGGVLMLGAAIMMILRRRHGE